jgi:hypothetical protein
LKAGYKTCLACGDKEANAANEALKEQVIVPFNKGGYQLHQNVEELKGLGK